MKAVLKWHHSCFNQQNTRRLATANRSRIGIRVKKIFCQGRGVFGPVKFPSDPVWSPHKIWSLFLIPCVRIGWSKNFCPAPWDRARLTNRNTPVTKMCYRACQIWSLCVKLYMGVRKVPKFLETLEPTPSPLVTLSNLVVLVKRYSECTEIP